MVRSRGSRAVEEVEEAEAAVIGTSVQLYASAACADMAKGHMRKTFWIIIINLANLT